MFRIFTALILAFGLGALFAARIIDWPIRPGWIGAALLVAAALGARTYWDRRRRQVGDDPGAPEREVWQGMVGTAVVCGHLLSCLAQPGVDLHVGHGNTLALDNWTLLAGAAIGYAILRNQAGVYDERDRVIAALGTSAGYVGLMLLLTVLLMFLGFAPPSARAGLSHFVLGNLLIALIMLSVLAKLTVQLVVYRRDAVAGAEAA